jgi:heparin/heparan-sulfate lyase
MNARLTGLLLLSALVGMFSSAPVLRAAEAPVVGKGVPLPVPPAEHPRLYLRKAHAAQIADRLQDPVLQGAVARLQKLAGSSAQHRVEWQALQFLARPDPAQGRRTVEEALALLKQSELPARQDGCRVTGRMMVTGAIVYDWLYALISADEKRQFVAEFVRLAKTQECGYPPTQQGSVTGHSSEAMIMRDMISAGIAIYDEFPEMYQLAAGRFFREHLPARNWFYDGHAYHQGDSYGAHRYSWDTFPLFIFDRMGAGNVYNPEQRYVPYLWVYTTRPDGQRLRAGDTFKDSTRRGEPWNEFVGTLFTASYYHDGVLLSQFLKQGGAGSDDTLFEFLWRDSKLQPKPIESLPLSRYFGAPFGWMVARTGWGEDAVIAELKINEYNFVNHQHLDAGAFQIYHRGPLAIDSGLYQGGSGGAYGSPHTQNYSWRTIAHNSLLVHDPAETFHPNGSYGNEGGQRLPNRRSEPRNLEALLDPERGYRTGRVLAHGFGPDAQTPDYTLLQGDITAAYSNKVRAVTRSFVFLNLRNADVPAALVVFDRVVSADPAFRKYWLLHTIEEPEVKHTSARVDRSEHGANGRLNLDVLWPTAENAALEKIGGAGRDFWVFGKNYTNDLPLGATERTSKEPGAWRIELTPKAAAAEDVFFTVMQTTDRRSSGRWPVQRLEAGERIGCIIAGPDARWVVSLRKDNARAAGPFDLAIARGAACRVLVTDLAAGHWRAKRAGSNEARDFTATAESGAGWFEGAAGTWTVSRVTD